MKCVHQGTCHFVRDVVMHYREAGKEVRRGKEGGRRVGEKEGEGGES